MQYCPPSVLYKFDSKQYSEKVYYSRIALIALDDLWDQNCKKFGLDEHKAHEYLYKIIKSKFERNGGKR